jgi:hypothetical protein
LEAFSSADFDKVELISLLILPQLHKLNGQATGLPL